MSAKLTGVLGPDAAEGLVTWLDELRADREATRADFAELRQQMLAMESRLTARISSIEVKLEQRSFELTKWSFVFWAGVMLAILLDR